MKEQYEMIRLFLSEKCYAPIFSDEYYENEAKQFMGNVNELKSRDIKEKDYYKSLVIPMGKSRIGGSVVDIPPNIEYPQDTSFVAQLNCEDISKHDKLNLLPKKGFIYIFTTNLQKGFVFYSSADVSQLERVIKQEAYWYSFGQLIEHIESKIDSFDQRYVNENGQLEWSCITGEDITKIYGIYTNCQASEFEVREVMENEQNILLLQVGTDYQENCGAQSIYIKKDDLLNLDFSKCVFEYTQS
ncbi:MAG: DUF1963 domain-containing protein [Moraxellaceae bacterium]|nr:DUF1963 domain-containing protein [Moraxellaceae bacterium]